MQSSDLGRNEVENFHLKFVLTALNGNSFLSLSYSTSLNINTIAARVVLTAEFKELTTIGNNFRIRHHETNKIDIVDIRHYDYFFNRCLALIALALQYLQ